MATIVICIILVCIAGFALKGSIQHFKGEGGCCGGGSGVIEERKTLQNPVIGTYKIYIDGMHCENCKASVERNINRIEGAACRVNLKKKVAVVEYDQQIKQEELKKVIERLGYTVERIEG